MLRKERSPNFGASLSVNADSIDFENEFEIEKLLDQDWLIEEMHIQFDEFRYYQSKIDLGLVEKRIKTFLSYFIKNIQSETPSENSLGIIGLEQLYLLVVEVLERINST